MSEVKNDNVEKKPVSEIEKVVDKINDEIKQPDGEGEVKQEHSNIKSAAEMSNEPEIFANSKPEKKDNH